MGAIAGGLVECSWMGVLGVTWSISMSVTGFLEQPAAAQACTQAALHVSVIVVC